MTFFDIILKIIRSFRLGSSEDHATLVTDVKEWESTAVPGSEDKLKALYAKAHQGVWLRLLNPFLYFIIFKKMKDLIENDGSDEDEDDFLN